LQNGLDAGVEQEDRCRDCAHMRAGAGAVGDVDCVCKTAERSCFSQQFLRVAGDRRGNLRRHDKAVRPHTLGKAAGQGGGSIVHHVLAASASELERLYVLRLLGNHADVRPLFWTEKTRPARELRQ
jgi:hypothetical protein